MKMFLLITGETYPLPKGRVLTGITIAKKSDPLTLYFGCYSEDHGQGGLGMVQWSATHTGLNKTLKPVTSNKQAVYGGALFLVEDRPMTCNHDSTGGNLCPTTEPCYCASHSNAGRLIHMAQYLIPLSIVTTVYNTRTE